MGREFVVIQLNQEEKAHILEKTSFFIHDKITKSNLNNGRKKNIRFEKASLHDIIGELCYYFNRCNDDYEFMVLDELISHLESAERTS